MCRLFLAAIAISTLAPVASAQLVRYDFSAVTQLASDAIVGQGLSEAVPGFDLLLLKDGRTVYHRAFGNWTLNRVAAADSSTKTLAGAVIVSLEQTNAAGAAGAGRFSLNTQLGEYFPSLSPPLAGITIRQAFSHTSGIGQTTLAEAITFNSAVSSTTLTLQQAAAQMLTVDLAYTPGTSFLYGGNSMHIAGAVAERASGQLWNDLFAARIAAPLGLTATRFVLSSPNNPRIAAGCQSNATEFARFMEMLRRGGTHPTPEGGVVQVLSPAAVQALFARQSPNPVVLISTPYGSVTDYGVGVWLDQRNAQGVLTGAIAAGARGFASWVDFDDQMVGVFATDTTNSDNVQPLYNLIRAAAEQAVRNPLPCIADFDASSTLDVSDIFSYLNAFFTGAPAADITGGGLDTLDIFEFLNLWFAGCSEA